MCTGCFVQENNIKANTANNKVVLLIMIIIYRNFDKNKAIITFDFKNQCILVRFKNVIKYYF